MLDNLLTFIVVGFGAQLVDGAIGMAYGVISTSVLLSIGIPPAVASAAVHTAEIATTGLSGLSHAMFRNVDYALFRRLVIPGVMGSILGAYVITKIPTEFAKPIIATYLLIMGSVICYKALKGEKFLKLMKSFLSKNVLKHRLPSDHAVGLTPLGLGGGFLDAAGGGGWGPIVTSSLLAQGTTPHFTIGSVNLVEFLVTLSAS
ncbi:MAG: sulfite exporter TauE/SafE family protein, partial [Pseudomonadota bacterium]|nr:sulfite exporter TauE/SafE family protein [Pseudomonadota bacterium]